MTWLKLDDGYPDHPKIQRLGDDYDRGVSLDLQAMCYAARNLTDGFIPRRVFAHQLETIDRLVEVGRWEVVDGGYLIHDFLEYNPSREQVMRQRREWRVRQERSRKVSRRDTQEESSSPVPVPVPDTPSPNPLPDLTREPYEPSWEEVDRGERL